MMTLGLLLGKRVTDLLSTVAPLSVNSGILKNTYTHTHTLNT